jgi:hypothetical protein
MRLVRFWLLFASALGHPFLRALVLRRMRALCPLFRIGRSGVLLRFLMDLWVWVCVWVFAFERR